MVKSLPAKFEESMQTLLQGDFPLFASSLQQPAPISIRLHPIKYNRNDVLQRVPWSETGMYLTDRPVFTMDPLLHSGAYYVQEASSMFLEQALKQSVDLRKALNVLDLCAAPGGKSTHILSLISRESLLVANEVIRSRAHVLSENIQKWGYPNAIVTNNDPEDFERLGGFFDVIVVDAPCSGEGLFRKDPEAIHEWSSEKVQLCCNRQKRILSDVWPALSENGILIYSTCTYNTFEDEQNLAWLEKNHRVEFERLSLDPSWGVEEITKDNIIAYRFFPHRAKGEGFFLSVIRKLEGTKARMVNKKTMGTPPAKHIKERLSEWVLSPGDIAFFQFNDLLFYTSAARSTAFEFLLHHLKVVYAGTNLATLKHEKLIPDHAMALSIDLNRNNFPIVEISKPDALKYLHKDVIELPGEPAGFTLLTYQNVPIGWVNVLPNRVNNMYPHQWRIRMRDRP